MDWENKVDNTLNVAQVFAFANRYRGAYSNSLYHAVCPFYCDFNGYQVRKKQLNRQSNLVFYYFSISRWMVTVIWRVFIIWTVVQDELLWGAAWLHKASRKRAYREFIVKNEVILRAGDTINEFGWDNKHAGINVLISKVI